MRRTSCGVIVTDGVSILLGHAARSPRWDIPKGIAEPGETFAAAAWRELEEETGLRPDPADLTACGAHTYLPGKDLALFVWRPSPMPAIADLVCRSVFTTRSGETLPEFDRFALFAWDEAMARVGRNLARVLGEVAATVRRGS